MNTWGDEAVTVSGVSGCSMGGCGGGGAAVATPPNTTQAPAVPAGPVQQMPGMTGMAGISLPTPPALHDPRFLDQSVGPVVKKGKAQTIKIPDGLGFGGA